MLISVVLVKSRRALSTRGSSRNHLLVFYLESLFVPARGFGDLVVKNPKPLDLRLSKVAGPDYWHFIVCRPGRVAVSGATPAHHFIAYGPMASRHAGQSPHRPMHLAMKMKL